MIEQQQPDSLMVRLKQYAKLEDKARDLEKKLATLQQQQAILEPSILEGMAESGTDSLRLGGYTFYPDAKIYASLDYDKDVTPREEAMDRAVKALRKAKLGELVKTDFAPGSLSAWARERVDAVGTLKVGSDLNSALPRALRGIIKLSGVTKLKLRKVTSKK